MHDRGVLDGSDDAEPAATARAAQDIESERQCPPNVAFLAHAVLTTDDVVKSDEIGVYKEAL